MAFASWIPASPGAGMPRYGCGLYDTATITHWNRQIGLPIKFLLGYTGFSNISGMVSGFYYATHTRDVPGTWSSGATGIIPVIGTSLATVDGAMTLANNASGANDATWKQCIINMFAGWSGSEIWLRLNYESNIQTTSGGYTNGNTAWAPAFKAAFEHVAPVCYAAVPAGKTLRIIFDTCPLNFISSPNGNALSLYQPNSSTWDILGMDVYTGNVFPTDLSSWTNYAASTPFTLGASTTAAPGGATDDAWATDYNVAAGPNNGNPGYTYNNMGHYLCFPDAKAGSVNGGQGQSLYSLIQAALTAQKPIFHPEFGAVDATYTAGVLTGQGGAGLDLIGAQIQLVYPYATSTEAASNDLNYFPYFKRMWAAIEAIGVPVLGFCLWDQYGGNLLSGPDVYSGGAAPGMRPSVQVFGYPIGHYGAVDPYISMTEIVTPAAFQSAVPTVGIPPGVPFTVQVNCNYAVTLSHFKVDLGTGLGQQALPGTPALVGSNSFTFAFTPVASGGPFNLVIHDTTLGYASPPNDYTVTGTVVGPVNAYTAPNATTGIQVSSAWADGAMNVVYVGSTANTNVYYDGDNMTAANGKAYATIVLNGVEAAITSLTKIFGYPLPTNTPYFSEIVADGSDGTYQDQLGQHINILIDFPLVDNDLAYHDTSSSSNIALGLTATQSTDATNFIGAFVAELTEVYMSYISGLSGSDNDPTYPGNGQTFQACDGFGLGEGLSQLLEYQFVSSADALNTNSIDFGVESWISTTTLAARQNFIDTTPYLANTIATNTTAQNNAGFFYQSIGCNIVFLSWLRHLGYTYSQIFTALNTIAFPATPQLLYTALTSTATDPWTAFIAAVNAAVPVNLTSVYGPGGPSNPYDPWNTPVVYPTVNGTNNGNTAIPATAGTGPDTLVLTVSGFGSPTMFLSIDGVHFGSAQTITAVYPTQIQTFTLTGFFGTGTHVVTVTPTNQTAAGVDIFVWSVAFDGVVTGEQASLFSRAAVVQSTTNNIARNFTFVGGTASTGGGTVTPPPVTTATTPQQDYASLVALAPGKLVCLAEFRPGSETAGDNTFVESTLISALQTQMPLAVFYQQWWDTNSLGAGWGLASVQGAAAALSLPWVLNLGEFAVNPPTGVRTELITINLTDGTLITATEPAGVTILSQTLQ